MKFRHPSKESGMQQEPREVKYTTPVLPGKTGAPASFEEAYLQFAPLLRKIAVKKFGIPVAEAEPLVHDVFATYFTNAGEVHDVGPYLIGGICNAARHHLRRIGARDAIFCDDVPCAAAPTESIQLEVERKLLLRRLLARIGSRCRDLLHRDPRRRSRRGARRGRHVGAHDWFRNLRRADGLRGAGR